MKSLEHFIKLIHEINLQNEDYFVSFDVSLFTNIPVEEVLRVTRNRPNMDGSFPERSSFQVEDIMELLDICLTTTYFWFEDKFYQQKEGMAMRNSLSPEVSNILYRVGGTCWDITDQATQCFTLFYY
jgi:hypothetical protein